MKVKNAIKKIYGRAPLKKPTDIHARESDWEHLVDCCESDTPELAIVLGRRRAGKSYLLTRFAHAADGIYYQATRKTEKEQLLAVSKVIGEHFGDPLLKRIALPSWEDLFSYVVERTSGGPLVLVLDEFPYLVDSAPALPSIVQSLWDHELSSTRIKLILSGSHITAMRRLTEADQPLFGRRTRLIHVHPFDYSDAGLFAPEYTPRDKLLLYGIFGGLPGHLRLVDPRLSLRENAIRHILHPTARLHDEAVHVFDTFVRDAEVHYSILEAIAHGETRWNKISNRIGKQSASLQRPLDWLLEMGVVRREAPITEYPNPGPKTFRYSVSDPYLLFWHRFIADIKARGLASLAVPEDLWRKYVDPRLGDHMGMVFERACRAFVARGTHPALPFRPVQVGAWWTDDHQEEVDVVALGNSGEVLVGECKWGKAGNDDLDRLKRRAGLVVPQLVGVESVSFALFSAAGFGDAAVQERIRRGEALHFPIEELYAR